MPELTLDGGYTVNNNQQAGPRDPLGTSSFLELL